MVQLLSSQATRNITVTVLSVNTSLSISAPASVVQGTSFAISGILIRNDTGGPVRNASITVSYNGNIIGIATTGVDGDYLITGTIPSPGNFTLKAQFGGMSLGGLMLSPSMASMRIGTTGVAISPGILLLGIIGAYLLTRKG